MVGTVLTKTIKLQYILENEIQLRQLKIWIANWDL